MVETQTPTPSFEPGTPSTPPSSAADQARIRKERREAKIRAGGSARLNKITGLGGGVQRDPPQSTSISVAHGDPDEVDISQHFYEPKAARRSQPVTPNDDKFRQMMLDYDASGVPPPGANPFAGFPGMEGAAPGEDPMMKMLQQMMGGAAGEGADGMSSFPGMPGMARMGQAAVADPYAYIWRIVHAVFALGLGLYISFTTTFSGSKIARLSSGAASSEALIPASIHFFYIFATAQVLLQTTSFFLEKGAPQQGGILGTIVGFLPEPYKGYVQLASRYFRIWTTMTGDAMILVFVMGVCSWWQS
ncbi:hypothetical protein BJ878DRAFT_485841 [Calycina marina]|uniref:Golgi to ER traffic protein 2 n=1 Tax=Calycina marina TaxID=1763456 RepID=A0A9P7ZBB8_9HELO|nr:hypothetical protein BJ878DRAFT_485841 [Calycina marina]